MPVPHYADEDDEDLEPVSRYTSAGQDEDEDDDYDEQPVSRLDDPDDDDYDDEPDQRDRISNADRAREGNRRRQEADALARNGLAIRNGVPVIVNQALYDGWLQAQGRTEQPQAQQEEEDLGEPPDATLEPAAFNEWLAKRDAQNEKRILAKVDQRLQTVQPAVAEQALDRAFKVARAVLPDYGLGDLLDHPDLEKALGAALQRSGFEPHEWRDPDVLARVAGVINPLLRKTLPKRRESRRPNDTGRGYGSITPSRGGGAPREPVQVSDEDRRDARRMGVSVEEYTALGDENYDTWKAQQDRERSRATQREERGRRK